MQIIKSKFRTAYFGQRIFLYVILILFILYLFSLAYSNGQINFKRGEFWFALCFGLALFYEMIDFLIRELNEVTLNENEIIVKYIFTKKIQIIRYTEIKKVSINRTLSRFRSIRVSEGYTDLRLELTNRTIFIISPNAFENFQEIKKMLYEKIDLQTNFDK